MLRLDSGGQGLCETPPPGCNQSRDNQDNFSFSSQTITLFHFTITPNPLYETLSLVTQYCYNILLTIIPIFFQTVNVSKFAQNSTGHEGILWLRKSRALYKIFRRRHTIVWIELQDSCVFIQDIFIYIFVLN